MKAELEILRAERERKALEIQRTKENKARLRAITSAICQALKVGPKTSRELADWLRERRVADYSYWCVNDLVYALRVLKRRGRVQLQRTTDLPKKRDVTYALCVVEP